MNMDFSPITGGREIDNLFEVSNRSQVFLCDDEEKGYSCFIFDTKGFGADKMLIVRNANHKELVLMRIDGVLFPRMTKCDCALIFDKEFDFVELKTNAANQTEESMYSQYVKSYNQIKVTVLEFEKRYRSKNLSFRDLFDTVQAYSVFNPTVPNNNATQKSFVHNLP